jgi:teichuronic acid biosynthesis glycosyltransferase TuaC
VKIAAVTPSFPTREEPYRGLAIWSLLDELARLSDLAAYCSLPRYFSPIGKHRDFIHGHPWLDSFAGVRSSTLRFPAVPVLTRPLNGWLLSRPLSRALRDEPPDAVVAFWIHPEGDAALRACVGADIPLVVVSVGSDLKRPSPHPWIRRRIRAVVSRADRMLAVSEDLCAIARSLGAPADRVRLLELGVDDRIYRPADRGVARRSLGIADATRLVLFAGRFVPLKGLPRLVDSAAILHRREPGRWQLALAGNGSEERALQRQVEAAGLSDSVRFLGPLPPEEVARWMNAADVLCLPSETEGRPNVVLEALSCGCPVVATPVGGIPELVRPTCGVLVHRDGAEALADALCEVTAASWDRAAISRAYRRSWRETASSVLEACEAAAKGRPALFTQRVAAPG